MVNMEEVVKIDKMKKAKKAVMRLKKVRVGKW